MAILLDSLGETGPFDGFAPSDFEAFEPRKWASRVYTMERRAARQKLVALARTTTERAGGGYEVGASDDAPSVLNGRKVDAAWAYLIREKPQRDAIASRLAKTDLADASALFDIALEHQHASLVFRLDVERFAVEVLLTPRARVDRSNAATKLGYREDRETLVELCRGLPAGALIGFGASPRAAHTLDPEAVEGLSAELDARPDAFGVRVEWPRGHALLSEPSFAEVAVDAGVRLLAVLRHLAWSRDNDFAKVGVGEALEKVDKKLRKAAPPQLAALGPGARVKILSGLFAGRSGYLAESDGKGNVKVMVGPVSVSVPAQDIEAG